MERRKVMGTASYGAYGSGSGLRSGSGDGGTPYSDGGDVNPKPYTEDTIKMEVSELIKEQFTRAAPYLQSMFHNSYLAKVYAELFALSALLKGEQPIEKIGARYHINMNEPEFIFNLIGYLDQKFRSEEVDSRVAQAGRITLEKVLLRAVKEDPYLSIDGKGEEVVEAMRLNTPFWKGLSGQVLANLAITIYKKDTEAKMPEAAIAAAREIERRTNEVIKSFEGTSGGKKVEYRDLFEYIDQHWDWFKEEMTQ
jgi:hypothetical protein